MNLKCFVFLLFVSCGMSAQEYTPLLDNLNEWHLTSCFNGCLTDVYFTDGDTVVGGKTHKILDGFHYISRTFLLREDVAEKKVYLTKVTGINVEEFLLYDFSLSVGNSFEMMNPYTPHPFNGGLFVLDSIVPRELADAEEYDFYYFSPAPTNTTSSNNAVWVEGAGSLSLVTAPGGDADFEGAGHLSCSFRNASRHYVNLDSISSCDPVYLSSMEYNPLVGTELLYESVNNSYFLTDTMAITEAKLYSVDGKEQLLIKNNFKERIYIDTTNLRSGIYLLKVSSTNGSVKTFKLIVH